MHEGDPRPPVWVGHISLDTDRLAESHDFMVALGMVGVFWQAVTARTGEIGLRRALGGGRGKIYGQFLLEIVILISLGSWVAALLVIQLPLFDLPIDIDWGRTVAAALIGMAVMYLLGLVAGLYPAWLAARIEPAAALHDD